MPQDPRRRCPELEGERGPAFEAMLDDLGVHTPDDLARRARAAIAFLPALWEAMEAIMPEVL